MIHQWQNYLCKFWGNYTGLFFLLFFFSNFYTCDHFKVHFALSFFNCLTSLSHWSHSVSLVFTTWYTCLNFKDNPFANILHRVFVLPAKHNIVTSLKWNVIPEYIVYIEYSTEFRLYSFRVVEFCFWLFPSVTTLWVSFSAWSMGRKYYYHLCRKYFWPCGFPKFHSINLKVKI